MATTEKVKYPKVSQKLWWGIRSKFNKTVPTTVSPSYVASVSDMTDGSARSNVIAPLRLMGILDDQNSPTDLGKRWRLDDEYPKVCHEILKAVYPSALLETYPDAGEADRGKIESWFQRTAHVGAPAARMFTDTFLLLSKKDPSAATEAAGNGKSPKRAVEATRSKKETKVVTQSPSKQTTPPSDSAFRETPPPEGIGKQKKLPSIHIDVQVHISSDSTPEQIETIFASMAKHLGGYIN